MSYWTTTRCVAWTIPTIDCSDDDDVHGNPVGHGRNHHRFRPGIFESFRYAFDRLGVESPTDEQLRAYLGPPLLDTFREILQCDEAEGRLAVDIYREDYLTRGVYVADVFPGSATV